MTNRIQVRRDTAANWTTANPILTAGEPGLETDTGHVKWGNGVTAWNALGYAATQADLAAQALLDAATYLALPTGTKTVGYAPVVQAGGGVAWAAVSSGGGGGSVVDNGDGTLSSTSSSIADNGDGTLTAA